MSSSPHSEDRDSGPIGPELGERFRILAELGRGGCSAIYLAEDRKLRGRVALKVLRRRGVLDAARRRFRREAEAASHLAHPGICPVHEFVETGEWLVIAMGHVDGQSLERHLQEVRETGQWRREGILTPGPGNDRIRAAADLVERAARAVHAAHEAGVLHRDLKPSNIMVTPAGSPVIVDFGLAGYEDAASSLTATGDLLGTPAYASPEQIEGQREQIDRRTDVYSLGVVLFECLALRRPFQAEDREGLVRAVLSGRAASLRRLEPRVPRNLRIVVETAMAVDPNDRYDTALALADDLGRWKRGEPIRARRPGALARAARWTGCNRLPAALVTAILATLSAGLGSSLFALRESRAALERAARLSDFQAATFLLAEFENASWPGTPGREAAMEQWLEDCTRLLSARAAHEGRLRELVRPTDGDPEIQRLRSFLRELNELGDVVREVLVQQANLSSLRERSLREWRDEWARAIAEIAASPLYDYRQISPQPGLVPLGPDPDSQLQEFAHLQSGDPPQRDPLTGRFQVNADTGIVLVLLPGGRFTMGARRPDEEHPAGTPHVDPHCWPADTEPLDEVDLAPFFLAKYETTQRQWLRLTGKNPSTLRPGSRQFDQETGATLAHPVESVDWNECEALARRTDLILPTEAQWEYACRAGTTTPWYCEEAALGRFENLCDEAARRVNQFATWYTPGLEDGHPWHAPVGSYQANPFGLHDMLGNVLEWCCDRFGSYEQPVRLGDGLRQGAAVGRAFRGGNYLLPVVASTCAARRWVRAESLADYAGVRFARPLR